MRDRPELDPVLHEPIRQRICSVLVLADDVGLDRLQHLVALTEATLSEHVDALVATGYLRREGTDTESPSVALTSRGRTALVTYEAERDRLTRRLGRGRL